MSLTSKLRLQSLSLTSKLRLQSLSLTSKLRLQSLSLTSKLRLQSLSLTSKLRLQSHVSHLQVKATVTVSHLQVKTTFRFTLTHPRKIEIFIILLSRTQIYGPSVITMIVFILVIHFRHDRKQQPDDKHFVLSRLNSLSQLYVTCQLSNQKRRPVVAFIVARDHSEMTTDDNYEHNYLSSRNQTVQPFPPCDHGLR